MKRRNMYRVVVDYNNRTYSNMFAAYESYSGKIWMEQVNNTNDYFSIMTLIETLMPSEVLDWNNNNHPSEILHIIPALLAHWTSSDIFALNSRYHPSILIAEPHEAVTKAKQLEKELIAFCAMDKQHREEYVNKINDKLKSLIVLDSF